MTDIPAELLNEEVDVEVIIKTTITVTPRQSYDDYIGGQNGLPGLTDQQLADADAFELAKQMLEADMKNNGGDISEFLSEWSAETEVEYRKVDE